MLNFKFMVKRFMTFVAAVIAAAATFTSCDKEDKPTVEFEKILYTVHAQRSVDVTVVLSEPAATDISVSIMATGAASSSYYELSGVPVTVKAGQTTGTFSVKNLGLTEEKQLKLSIVAPSGYEAGAKEITVITPDPEETLVYSFKATKAEVLGSYIAQMTVTGVESGEDLSLGNDVVIPMSITGDAAKYIVYDTALGDGPCAVLPAGKRTASFSFSLSEGFTDGDAVSISVDLDKAERFIPGDNETLALTLFSVNVPDNLLGTWTFDKVFDADELMMWFEEMEDDSALLPLNNTGFTLTFTKDAAGVVTVTPNDKGDFANYFREATVTPTEPKNYSSEGKVVGKNAVEECTMFMAEAGFDVHTNRYYKLSSANRAFSKTKESLGEAVVVFTVIDGDLVVELRDYDTPPFGENWWSDAKFDADMFSFASLFKKQ
jgi:hypothetical protein